MANLRVLAALLAALLAVSAVSALRTTITTTVVEDEENPGRREQPQGSCQEQISKQQNFESCQRYLSQRTRRGEGEELMMVTGGENPEQREEGPLRQCCRQMENVREECRCEGLSTMMKQQQQQRRGQREEMLREAENLPAMCNLSPGSCQIKIASFFY